jgi:two-component system nitrate/nitrite response regulator NarL
MRIVLCDRNRILCEALAAVLEARGHQVVAVTAGPAEGIAAVAAHRPDACVLDLRFPGGGSGLDVAWAIRRRHLNTKVLVFSGLADPAAWSEAKKIGAAGCLRKDQKADRIVGALDVIAAGGVVFDPMLPRQASAPRSRRQYPPRMLTAREKEVLCRLVAGQSTEQMAEEMNIATSTLRTYVKRVLTKLGAHNRLQAAALATRENLLSDQPAA